MHDTIITLNGLFNKWFNISLLTSIGMFIQKLQLVWYLAYAGVKFTFACMH